MNDAKTTQAIAQVLEADLCSYLARDKQTWERQWVQDHRFKSYMECGPLQIADSFEAFRDNIFAAMDAEPVAVDAKVQRENLEIYQNGDMAWAVFEEIVTLTSDPTALPYHSHNFRLLEKQDDQWRIIFHGAWTEPLRDLTTPAIEVESDGAVLWMNQPAAEALQSFRGLTISNGKLRASRPAWNDDLVRAIQGAHRLTGFGQYNQAQQQNGGGKVSFPVTLGESEDGGLLLCRAQVADGRVYILFGDTNNLDRQIGMVQAIYSLSAAQVEMVKHIAGGLDLAEAADALGITKNTARTHLRRVYDKVGVSSQIELLRLIVSFAG